MMKETKSKTDIIFRMQGFLLRRRIKKEKKEKNGITRGEAGRRVFRLPLVRGKHDRRDLSTFRLSV